MTAFRRSVDLVLTDEFLEDVGGLPNKIVEQAIGYLSHWAIAGGRFAYVKITCDKSGCLTALYFECAGSDKLGYEIYAQARHVTRTPEEGGGRFLDSYSFHS